MDTSKIYSLYLSIFLLSVQCFHQVSLLTTIIITPGPIYIKIEVQEFWIQNNPLQSSRGVNWRVHAWLNILLLGKERYGYTIFLHSPSPPTNLPLSAPFSSHTSIFHTAVSLKYASAINKSSVIVEQTIHFVVKVYTMEIVYSDLV